MFACFILYNEGEPKIFDMRIELTPEQVSMIMGLSLLIYVAGGMIYVITKRWGDETEKEDE